MKILINNSLALSKMHDLQLLHPFLFLDIEFFADPELCCHLQPETMRVYNELLMYGRIKELDYTSEEMSDIGVLCKQFPNLSRFESASLYLAQREEIGLFATNTLVRDAASGLGLAAFGYNWVFDQIHQHQIFSPMVIFNKWKDLEKLFYISTDTTMPLCVQSYYEGSTKPEVGSTKSEVSNIVKKIRS